MKTPSGEPPKKLLTHSKLVLVMLPTLLIIGMSLIYISEWSVILPLSKDKVLTSVFRAVSASTTTGFNTMDAGTMKTLALITMVVLMYIGASPGGTGGGVKTTTFGLLISSVISVVSKEGRVDNV